MAKKLGKILLLTAAASAAGAFAYYYMKKKDDELLSSMDEDFDDFMDDWDGEMPDGSNAEDYWDDW